MMFTGEYRHSVDAKNRLSIPSKFREKLGDTFYITKGLDHCLFIFSMDEWQLFEEKLKALPLSNKKARAFARSFFAGAAECALDKQGRILLPQPLREHASIDREVYINGAGSRVEVWDQKAWEAYNDFMTANMDDLAEDMESLGISF
ncbi:cell division protein MraZ [Fusibacter sp. 3D3]|nr:cell division protein MraZ [Fusibacter sp. 3D3]